MPELKVTFQYHISIELVIDLKAQVGAKIPGVGQGGSRLDVAMRSRPDGRQRSDGPRDFRAQRGPRNVGHARIFISSLQVAELDRSKHEVCQLERHARLENSAR